MTGAGYVIKSESILPSFNIDNKQYSKTSLEMLLIYIRRNRAVDSEGSAALEIDYEIILLAYIAR